MQNLQLLFVRFVFLFLLLGVVFGTIYTNGQQGLRQGIAEGPYWLAHETTLRLENGAPLPPAAAYVAIESEGELYTVIYDAQGNPTGGTGYLHGALPRIPAGIFYDVAHGRGRDLLTWQPEPGVRQDIDVVPLAGGKGYVLAGRSLAYAEREAESLFWRTAFGFAAALALVIAYLAACYYYRSHGRRLSLRRDTV